MSLCVSDSIRKNDSEPKEKTILILILFIVNISINSVSLNK